MLVVAVGSGAFPMSYPSFAVRIRASRNSLEARGPFPKPFTTTRAGDFVIDHGGSYASGTALDRDIQRYALR